MAGRQEQRYEFSTGEMAEYPVLSETWLLDSGNDYGRGTPYVSPSHAAAETSIRALQSPTVLYPSMKQNLHGDRCCYHNPERPCMTYLAMRHQAKSSQPSHTSSPTFDTGTTSSHRSTDSSQSSRLEFEEDLLLQLQIEQDSIYDQDCLDSASLLQPQHSYFSDARSIESPEQTFPITDLSSTMATYTIPTADMKQQQRHQHHRHSPSVPSSMPRARPRLQHRWTDDYSVTKPRPKMPHASATYPGSFPHLQRPSSTLPYTKTSPVTRTALPTRHDGQAHRSPSVRRPEAQLWTCEEDDSLRALVTPYTIRHAADALPWDEIHACFPHRRTLQQIKVRWLETLQPGVKKGKWGEDEDVALKLAHAKLGSRWARIAELIEGRTQRQCRTRWMAIIKRPT